MAYNRLKDKCERETLSHLEAKQKISDLERYLTELGQQLHNVQQEKMKLEHIFQNSGSSIPDDAKSQMKQFQFSPPPSLSSLLNGGKVFDAGNKLFTFPPPPHFINII